MASRDYYKILEVAPDASAEDIKRAYRRLALATHPDRNRNDPNAEERFKAINEAYGVLSDPHKRAQFDDYRRFGFHHQAAGQGNGARGFGYSQEEILRDLFRSGQAQDVFSELQREFQRFGFRFDDRFINNLFFGGQTIFFQGMIWSNTQGPRLFRFGNLGSGQFNRGTAQGKVVNTGQTRPQGLLTEGLSFLAKTGKKVGKYLLNKALGVADPVGSLGAPKDIKHSGSGDLIYNLGISADQAIQGGKIVLELPHLADGRKVSVSIPPGVKTGTRLRLKSLGEQAVGSRGDLYLELRVE